jgi:hypothetical protein
VKLALKAVDLHGPGLALASVAEVQVSDLKLDDQSHVRYDVCDQINHATIYIPTSGRYCDASLELLSHACALVLGTRVVTVHNRPTQHSVSLRAETDKAKT